MTSFEEVAAAKHALYIDALNDRVLQEARLRVKRVGIAALEHEDSTIREQGFNHTSALSSSYPALLIGHDLALARRDLHDQQCTTEWAVTTAQDCEADDTAHFEEHKTEYYDWALRLADLAGKDIQFTEQHEALLQTA